MSFEALAPPREAKTEILPGVELGRPTNTMDLLRLALSNHAAIDVIERLAALVREEQARIAETEFSEALNRVQEKIKRIAPDAMNKHTQSKWATYAAIDRVIRPIYAAEGFSLSFTHAECPKPDYIRVICWVRLRGHKEAYQVDWPVSTAGPKGTDIVTPVQATGISDSYAKRYLVKDIFNIAIGEDDLDGEMDRTPDFLALINESKTKEELEKNSKLAVAEAYKAKAPTAAKIFMEARQKREKELNAKQTEGPL